MSGVEEVLAAHGAIGYDGVDGCGCGADVRSHAEHRAHLAEELQPLIRQAQAEALREAAEAMPFGYSHAAFMLRERADLLAGDA